MLDITIAKGASRSLVWQLVSEIRERVQSGRLRADEKLPSTRALAIELGISRNVVAEAYEQLVAEGYLYGRTGSGTRVSPGARLPAQPIPLGGASGSGKPSLSPPRRPVIEFHSGNPDLRHFPVAAWAKSLQHAATRLQARQLGYGPVEGDPGLRQRLTEYLYRVRGVECPASRIVVVSGIAEAICLLTKLFDSPGPRVLIEDPCLDHVQTAFTMNGYSLVPVPADESGLDTHRLPEEPASHFVYTVPSHHFPLGGVLPAHRRIELVEYARRHDLLLIEDDYDCEFRYTGIPIQPLQTLAPERVLYFGSFSKVLFPSLRLAFLALPEPVATSLIAVKEALHVFSPIIEQLALSQWLMDGLLERHVHEMKKLYRRKRNLLVEAIRNSFGDAATIKGENAGLHLLVEIEGTGLSSEEVTALRANGVDVDLVETYAIVKRRHLHRLVMGYGSLSDEEIREGVSRLRSALRGK